MKNILLTGSTGFIGRNILPALQDKYNVSAPTRSQLELKNADAVRQFISKKQFDAVLHIANPTGHNKLDIPEMLFENSLRVFTSIAHCASLFGKMVYIGSGAEYGKHRSLMQIREESFGEELPKDPYGLSRYIMSELAERYSNIVGLRLFGCHGPGDPLHKLIPSVIAQASTDNTVTLRQDCWFDFLYVTDIADVLIFFIENENKHSSYNLCSGERLRIVTIAEEVCKQMCVNTTVSCKASGFNMEYTGSNARLRAEIPDWKPLSMKDSIAAILSKEGIS